MRNSILFAVVFAVFATACSDDSGGSLTVYSGRKEEIVAPLFERFEAETGIDLQVRYADSPDLAATLREEGSNTPADLFFAVDPASLGAVAEAGLFVVLGDDITSLVPSRFSDSNGLWVGTSGRSRVVVYDTRTVAGAELPDRVDGFTEAAWDGRLGIAPTNGSFVAFVAAMILSVGEDHTKQWLEGIADNSPTLYPKNSVIVAAVDDGEVDAGLVNHYYLLRRQAEVGETNATNHFLTAGGPGSLVMPAGVGIIEDSPEAREFVTFLLSSESQQFFASETFEYPVVPGIPADPRLPLIETLSQPDINLSDLAAVLDLATTLIADAGLL